MGVGAGDEQATVSPITWALPVLTIDPKRAVARQWLGATLRYIQPQLCGCLQHEPNTECSCIIQPHSSHSSTVAHKQGLLHVPVSSLSST